VCAVCWEDNGQNGGFVTVTLARDGKVGHLERKVGI
jgi:hypothetical protein